VLERQSTSGSPDYFLDFAFDQVKALNLQGDRTLTVRTTIDMGMQRAAEEAIEAVLRQHGNSYRVKQAALVGLETDGAVRAMVGGRDYGESQFNRATDALRQPGSSFKPFVYATAMQNGFTPKSVVRDAPICIGNWCPRNYSGGYSGAVTLTTALVKSINTIPVRLAQQIGRDKIVETAHKMGLNTELRITRSLPLGASEVTVIDMAGAYGAFASGGFKIPPYSFTQIINSRGEILYDRRRDAKPRERVLDDQTVAAMNEILSQVPEWGTGRQAKLDGIKTAGKTGTTSAYRDAWFAGYTGNYVAAVWFGNDGYAPTRRLTGGTLPAMTWKRFMTYAHNGIEIKPIPFVAPEEKKPDKKGGEAVADARTDDASLAAPTPVPASLSEETTARLAIIGELMLRALGRPVATLSRPEDQPALAEVLGDGRTTPPAPQPQ
jgi:penicillin-binding protein 1A